LIKRILAKDKLFIRVAAGFAPGIAIGAFGPEFSEATKIMGGVYLNLS